MRVAIYARYSSDLQNPKSIADQEALCRDYAQREGHQVVHVYSDAAISGGSMVGRDGVNELMADAKGGGFSAVIVEELDRLSRDMEDLAGIFKRLSFSDVQIIAVHEGVANPFTVGLRGIYGHMFRVDLGRKVRRGLTGKVRLGLSAGGRAYGYVPDLIEKGVLHIVPEEAEIVRTIFAAFADGATSRQIAHRLNREGIKPPRGSRWNASAICGWEARGSGILRNRLYVGQRVWNKVQMVKDPDTGKRISRPNPSDKREVRDVPELRIIEQDVFDAVQAILNPKPRTARDAGAMKRPKRLLSGLLRCAGCGAGMSVKGKDPTGRVRIQCSAYAESRTCPDPHTFYLDVLEDLVLDTLRAELNEPKRLVTYVQAYNDARRAFAKNAYLRRGSLERRISELDAELDRMVQFIAKGTGNPDRIGRDMEVKEAELTALKAELSLEPAALDAVVLHPLAIERYGQQLGRLREELEQDMAAGNTKAAEVMRELIESIVVSRNPETGKGISIQINGKLRHLLGQTASTQKLVGAMVAGSGLEPPTPGL